MQEGLGFADLRSIVEICPMFTGIIETTGIIKEVISNGSNKSFWIESSISSALKIDQSISHNGACLTVEEIKNTQHRVTAIQETLNKTNLGGWQQDGIVNLERCLTVNSRLDGHWVQGHVDTNAICTRRKEKAGSWIFEFNFPQKFSALIIEKGSITLNGISLTVFDVKKKSFKIAVIPYTFNHTNIQFVKKGDSVNVEFDLIGKYILRKILLNT